MFHTVGQGREFEINYRSRAGQGIRRIHQRYGDVILGERLALFNSAGFLEIAINQGAPDTSGGASQLTGGKVDDTVTIVFRV
jgi:S-adenosylmethionine hydrolase